ncbi:MAG: DUF6529 family protein, partial [Thermoleophilia bacterium]
VNFLPEISLAEKSLMASILLAVALLQLVWISLARGWFLDLPLRARLRAVKAHHIGGYAGLGLILTIAYYCVFVYGSSGTTRAAIHALLGAVTVGLVATKVVMARFFKAKAHRLPAIGFLLGGSIVGAWSTSALWYYTNF